MIIIIDIQQTFYPVNEIHNMIQQPCRFFQISRCYSCDQHSHVQTQTFDTVHTLLIHHIGNNPIDGKCGVRRTHVLKCLVAQPSSTDMTTAEERLLKRVVSMMVQHHSFPRRNAKSTARTRTQAPITSKGVCSRSTVPAQNLLQDKQVREKIVFSKTVQAQLQRVSIPRRWPCATLSNKRDRRPHLTGWRRRIRVVSSGTE